MFFEGNTLTLVFTHEGTVYESSVYLRSIYELITIDLNLNNEGIYDHSKGRIVGDYLNVTTSSSNITEIVINNYIGDITDVNLIFDLFYKAVLSPVTTGFKSHTNIGDFNTDYIFNLSVNNKNREGMYFTGDFLVPGY